MLINKKALQKMNRKILFEKFDQSKMIIGKEYEIKWQDGFIERIIYARSNVPYLIDNKPRVNYFTVSKNVSRIGENEGKL